MALVAFLSLCAACAQGLGARGDGVFAPGVNRLATAQDGVEVGHRLINAGEYELALRAFARATLERGETDAEILLGLGTANLGLGRLHQAERMFRLALEKEADWPELYNNLGVTLMEQGRTAEAANVFRKGYALDNGQTDEIRNNLRLALSKTDEFGHTSGQDQENGYKLVRRGTADYKIRKTP
ncbi:tetratricopeptide repeat protein [Aliishimia ponticola]|uniref:Tetratricopeptide repeat protein n=1 Tax=Aliishimia ponticola TaxID=2499833 RepID=A0A4V3XKJ8_9RHOB|nr:tetratricopeptide repeat protein [Aliishimia ponticola]THH37233.1 tetratricopeptide repeat protein [Aliishimia ponticola]